MCSLVCSLRGPVSPPAIAWLVIPCRIDAVQRQAIRLAHVSVEVFERPPALTDRHTQGTVPPEVMRLRVRAPLNHRLPDRVNRRLALAVASRGLGCIEAMRSYSSRTIEFGHTEHGRRQFPSRHRNHSETPKRIARFAKPPAAKPEGVRNACRSCQFASGDALPNLMMFTCIGPPPSPLTSVLARRGWM